MKAGEKQRTQLKHAGGPLIDLPTLKMDVTCPNCGCAVDLWTGGEETFCDQCGHRIFKKQRIDH